MSVHVTTQLKTRPEHTDEVITALSEALPHSLQHEGCEAIHLRQDQDDPTNIVSFTQWATRQNYEDYLAWRTETGMTDEIDQPHPRASSRHGPSVTYLRRQRCRSPLTGRVMPSSSPLARLAASPAAKRSERLVRGPAFHERGHRAFADWGGPSKQ